MGAHRGRPPARASSRCSTSTRAAAARSATGPSTRTGLRSATVKISRREWPVLSRAGPAPRWPGWRGAHGASSTARRRSSCRSRRWRFAQRPPPTAPARPPTVIPAGSVRREQTRSGRGAAGESPNVASGRASGSCSAFYARYPQGAWIRGRYELERAGSVTAPSRPDDRPAAVLRRLPTRLEDSRETPRARPERPFVSASDCRGDPGAAADIAGTSWCGAARERCRGWARLIGFRRDERIVALRLLSSDSAARSGIVRASMLPGPAGRSAAAVTPASAPRGPVALDCPRSGQVRGCQRGIGAGTAGPSGWRRVGAISYPPGLHRPARRRFRRASTASPSVATGTTSARDQPRLAAPPPHTPAHAAPGHRGPSPAARHRS